MEIVPCPNCSTGNKFPPYAVNAKVRCKNCSYIWRLTTTLPAVHHTPPPVPTAYLVERVTSAGRAAVSAPQPPPMPSALAQIEISCAVHDEPFSVLYTKKDGADWWEVQRVEKGSHAIDRYCGTSEGLQKFASRGGTVSYDRGFEQLAAGTLANFTCPWCAHIGSLYCCDDCGIQCQGACFTRFGVQMGMCRRSCPEYTPEGRRLITRTEPILGRMARLLWNKNVQSNLPPPPPPRQRLPWGRS